MRNSKPPVPFRPLTEVSIPPDAADALNAAGFRAQARQGAYRVPTLESRVNEWMGDPKGRAASYAESLVDPNEDPVDNVRHSLAGAYTAQSIADKIKYSSPIQNPLKTAVANAAGFAAANVLGAGHEIKHLPQLLSSSWSDSGLEGIYHALRMTGEDATNNFVGALVGTLRDLNGTDAAEVLTFLSNNNLLPDGVSVPSTAVKAGSPPHFYLKGEGPINQYPR